MDKTKRHLISKVHEGSIAWELGLEPGDVLLSIDGSSVEDVFDYRFLINDESICLEVEKPDGEIWELEIEKEFDEDLGIEFDSGLMDEYHSCRNHCIFCFIDQMPEGMRPTLYFKDDDTRLSFLQGNYVTLTNLQEKDIDRIIRYRLEPINISFQTTNPSLRCKMLHNRFAGEALGIARRFYEAGITMNGQIVLCRGINDGNELDRSIRDLAEYAPVLQSVSVVPVGLTRYREGLYPLEPFTREDAVKVVNLIHRWQHEMMERCGLHFVHASDEWYILAGLPLPEEESYDGYLQLENGVGMLRALESEFMEALSQYTSSMSMSANSQKEVHKTIATGVLAAPFLEELAGRTMKVFPWLHITVIPIINHFFGEKITVSGLITGQDLVAGLSGREIGDELLLPSNMLRSGEDVFLDDVTVSQIEQALTIPITIVEPAGSSLLAAFLTSDENHPGKNQKYGGSYEISSCSQRQM